MPVALLLAAYLLSPYVGALPASLAGLKVYGPYVFLALGGAVSLAFRRGRVLFGVLTLAIAYVSFRIFLQSGQDEFVAYAVFSVLCLFVPANLAALSLLKERGALNRHGLQRLSVIGAQIAFAAWIVLSRSVTIVGWAYHPLIKTGLLATSPLPQLGIAVITLCVVTSLWAWLVTRSAIDLGMAGATAAFGIAAHGITTPNMFAVFVTAAALILMTAVLQDTFRMAFRDELTGLPSRRSLNERLAGLGRSYTIAMLDVDRFKGLNDHYGHDVGDQVLKMVATQFARVGGGGEVYRYGGEEFIVLFPGKSSDEALPFLETLREDIADHKLALRKTDRPAQADSGKGRRGVPATEKLVSVTISIGVAESSERFATPDDVFQAADKALYRAKNKGRNQVSR
jgi:diguanylate cyclase (GGDEF)-like protein